MNFKFFLQTMQNAYFSCSKQIFYIIRMPISYSRSCAFYIFIYTSLYYFFMAIKVNRSTKSDFFLQISTNHNKKTDNQKKNLEGTCPPTRSFLSLDFFRRDVDLYSELGIV